MAAEEAVDQFDGGAVSEVRHIIVWENASDDALCAVPIAQLVPRLHRVGIPEPAGSRLTERNAVGVCIRPPRDIGGKEIASQPRLVLRRFVPGLHQGRFRVRRGNPLAQHVTAHEQTARVIVLQEGDERGHHAQTGFRSFVHHDEPAVADRCAPSDGAEAVDVRAFRHHKWTGTPRIARGKDVLVLRNSKATQDCPVLKPVHLIERRCGRRIRPGAQELSYPAVEREPGCQQRFVPHEIIRSLP